VGFCRFPFWSANVSFLATESQQSESATGS